MENEKILKNLWKVSVPSKSGIQTVETTWDDHLKCLYSLGISMEDAMIFLHSHQPEEHDFITWIEQRKRLQPKIFTDNSVSVLSKEDLQFWDQNGYVILKEAVPVEECAATCTAIWDYLGANPENKKSWYLEHQGKRGMMLQFSDHPILDKNRQSVKIKKAYEQLYGHTNIYKTIDKVSFNPPETNDYKFAGSSLHWDVSLKQPIPYKLQGLLYLNDCEANEGAFHCVPGFHKQIETWMENIPKEVNPRDFAPSVLNTVPVIGKAGDFVIWHQALPHCATPNRGNRPRMVQYMTYIPDAVKDQEEWI